MPKLMRRLFTLEQDHPATELPISQLRVCTILQAGSRSLSAISDELGISVSAVTQLADRLERDGIVGRVSEGEDRRVKYLHLTPRGAEVMRSRRESRIRRATAALEVMSASERNTLLNALESLLETAMATAPKMLEDPVGSRLES